MNAWFVIVLIGMFNKKSQKTYFSYFHKHFRRDSKWCFISYIKKRTYMVPKTVRRFGTVLKAKVVRGC